MTQHIVRTGRREERAAQIRADLLVAAERLLAEKGVERTTITDITSEAGVGFGTFYNYFSSKGEVYQELVRNGLDLLAERIDDRCGRTGDHRERLRIAAEEVADFAVQRSDLFHLLFTTNSDVHSAVKTGVEGLTRCLEGCLRDGFDAGAYQSVAPSLAVRAMIGIFAFVLRPLAGDRGNREAVTASLIRLIQGAVIGAPNR